MKYTVDYFIEKFSKISETQWVTGALLYHDNNEKCDKGCAIGWCNMTDYSKATDEALALLKLFGGNANDGEREWEAIFNINDSIIDIVKEYYPQATPKERILAALQNIKNNTFIPVLTNYVNVDFFNKINQ